ncbi:MAG: hypothetical protein PHV17_06140 [Candidatus Omnitrophica bacterium]|nr:hypothetical protein [Candidatus Omnitrophota bacterium]
MRVDLAAFIGILSAVALLILFVVNFTSDRRTLNAKKNIHLKRRQCITCISQYFTPELIKYWQCPLCGTINKEDDYQNRHNRG